MERARDLEELPQIVGASTARQAFSPIESARMLLAGPERPAIHVAFGDILNTQLFEAKTDADFSTSLVREARRTHGFLLDVERVLGVFSEAAATPHPAPDRRKWWERFTRAAPGLDQVDSQRRKLALYQAATLCVERMLACN